MIVGVAGLLLGGAPLLPTIALIVPLALLFGIA